MLTKRPSVGIVPAFDLRMEQTQLPADRIIVESSDLYNVSILEIYSHMISAGAKDSIPPVLVTPLDVIDMEALNERYAIRLRILAALGGTHILLDGNHKGLAHAIRQETMNSIIVTCERELAECRKLAKVGGLTCFPPVLQEPFPEAIRRLQTYLHDKTFLLSDKAEKWVSEGCLPEYMKRQYRKTSGLTNAQIRGRVQNTRNGLAVAGSGWYGGDKQSPVPRGLRGNKDYILAAGGKIPLAQISRELRDDYEVVKMTIESGSSCDIDKVSRRLSMNRELAELAVSHNGYAWKYINQFLQDEKMAILALNARYNSHLVFSLLPYYLKEDPDVKAAEDRRRRTR